MHLNFISLILDSFSLFSIFKNAISKYKHNYKYMQSNFQKRKINIRIKHILINDKNYIFKILYKQKFII